MLACGKNMGYWLEKGIIYYGDKWGNNAHNFILPTNCTDGHEGNALRKWRPGRSRESTLMQGVLYLHVLWRSAFQARRSRRAYPRTSSPVTIATLCTAFQADRPQRNRFAHELHELTRMVAMD